jgi:D-psicose/D-tagatose/L-ribulose 3-epimerase
MHLAIHNWMRPEPIERTVARIAKQGYDALEIQGAPQSYDTAYVGDLLRRNGLTCWGSVTLMMEGRNLLAADESVRATSVRYIKDVITMVKELEGHVVSLVPGTVGKIVPDGRPEEEWGWAVASMQECYEFAERAGVRLGVEPINRFETYFINRGDQALALAEATGPNCGICLDIFHMNLEEDDPFAMIRRAGDRLVGFHVADNNRLAPGMGTFDWPRIIDTLREIRFDGALSVEFCPPLDRTPANPFPGSIDDNPEGVSAEQMKFLEDHGSSAFTEDFYSMLTQRSIDTLRPLIR